MRKSQARAQRAKPRRRRTLQELGISKEEAKRVRASLGPLAEEWDDPEMDAWDEAYPEA